MEPAPAPLPLRTSSYASLRARHLDSDSACVLELTGEADYLTLGMLREEVAWLLSTACDRAVIELSTLTFCDVASARVLLATRAAAPVRLSGARGSVKRVLDVLATLQPAPAREVPRLPRVSP